MSIYRYKDVYPKKNQSITGFVSENNKYITIWEKISEYSQLSRSQRNSFVVYWTWHKSPL